MEEVIKNLIKQVLGADADVDIEVVKVPEGKTIEQVMAERGFKPSAEPCAGCGQHHEFIGPNGEHTFAHGDEETQAEKTGFKEKRAKALEGVRRKQAEVLRMYDLLKELEKSIAQKEKDRDIMDLMNEVSLFAQIRQIAGRI